MTDLDMLRTIVILQTPYTARERTRLALAARDRIHKAGINTNSH